MPSLRTAENSSMPIDLLALREAIGGIPADVSNDAIGDHVPKVDDIFAPALHSSAIDPSVPIVVGSRGAGKSFWSGALGQDDTRAAIALAYPKLGLDRFSVAFGFTGAVGGPDGLSVETLDSVVPPDAKLALARTFWWAAILLAAARAAGEKPRIAPLMAIAKDIEKREDLLAERQQALRSNGKRLLIVFDALDAISTEWPRRRMLTEALFEVAWAMRAYRDMKLKIFIRPDQLDDDVLQFVELPKLRTGAVRLTWNGADLYGLLFSRLALSSGDAFKGLLRKLGLSQPTREQVLQRSWGLAYDADVQGKAMELIAGPFMGPGPNGYKKGKTYDWPLKHLGDAFDEVTPRSFLGLMIAAAKRGAPPPDRVISPDGIRHGLREASKTRVDQLQLEFPWIKGVLAPMSGLLLPQNEKVVFNVWREAGTLKALIADAKRRQYLPPFDVQDQDPREADIFEALRRIGVMFRRRDERIDMPDLFRVAAKLLKKGGTAPL